MDRIRGAAGTTLLMSLLLALAGCGGGGKTTTSSASPAPTGQSSTPAAAPGGAVTRTAALAYARAVNLRAGDVPGTTATGTERVRARPSAAGSEFARCAGAPAPSRRVVDVASPKFKVAGSETGGSVGSSVEVMPTPALAKQAFEATSSPRGRSCVSKLLPELFGRRARLVVSHLSIRPMAPPVSSGPSFGYRISLDIGSATQTVPVYLDVFEQLHGAAEVGLSVVSLAHAPSASLERSALTILGRRASAARLG